MSRQRFEPMEYEHEQLMADLNEFMVDIKTNLFNIPINRAKPTIQEIDQITNRIFTALKKDATPLRKYNH